ncbi:TonB-dependent receptor [Myxococcota bacterium]|nr:TonB-dependent receptor [Myxococcota bacterium]
MQAGREQTGQSARDRTIGRLCCALLTALVASGSFRTLRAEPVRPDSQVPPARRTTPAVVADEMRPPALPEDPSAFSQVIEVERYAGEGKSVADLLSEAVGVNVRRFGGAGGRAEISIRGSAAQQVVVRLDGVRLNGVSAQGVDLSTLPIGLVERIVVTRGGGSVQAGSGAIGGVVDIVTRRAGGNEPWRLQVSGGSFGTWRGSALGSTQWGGDGAEAEAWNLLAGAEIVHTRGDWNFQPIEVETAGVVRRGPGPVTRINNASTRTSGLIRGGRTLGERGWVGWSDSIYYASQGAPGPATGGGETLGQSPTAHRRRIRNVAKLEIEGVELGAGHWDAKGVLFHRYERSRFRDPDPVLGGPVETDDRSQELGARTEWARGFDLGPTVHQSRMSLQVSQNWFDSLSSGDRDRLELGGVLQDEIAVWEGKVQFVPALRIEHTSGFDLEALPRLGVMLGPWKGFVVRGNLERSYRVPSFDELYLDEEFIRGDPNLRPEEALSADLGIELGLKRIGPLESLRLEVAAFRNDIDQSIVFQQRSPQILIASNTGAALEQGLEFSWAFEMFSWVAVSGNATLLEARTDAGRRLPGRPDTEVWLRFRLGGQSEHPWKFVVEAKHLSDFTVDAVGARVVPGRITYDASVSLRLDRLGVFDGWLPSRKLRLFVEATNVTDQSVRDSVGYPQPGREVGLGVEAVW